MTLASKQVGLFLNNELRECTLRFAGCKRRHTFSTFQHLERAAALAWQATEDANKS